MARILMIGAGGVATVAAHKIAQNADVFDEFIIASRRKEKCDARDLRWISRQPKWMLMTWNS